MDLFLTPNLSFAGFPVRPLHMETKHPRINWHNAFSQIVKHCWTPLGLEVKAEHEVAKNPLKIDVIVIRQEKTLSPAKLAQLPDGIREHLNKHNLIDFKSFHESYGWKELEKTDLYAKLYREQENIKAEDLSTFAVSSKTPRKLLTVVQDWVEIQGQGIYRIQLRFRDVILLVSNEMEPKEANDVLELFASQTQPYSQAIERMSKNPFWHSLQGILSIFLKRLGKEDTMSGLTMEQLGDLELPLLVEGLGTKKIMAALLSEQHDKEQVLDEFLSQLDDDDKQKLAQKLKSFIS